MRRRAALVSALTIFLACGLALGSCGPAPNSWIDLQPSGPLPSARFGEALAYVPGGGSVIMFGGASDEGTPLNDTWEYHRARNAWTELEPSGDSPPARWGAAAACDPGSSQIVIFGGMGAEGMMLNDTWAYDVAGSEWTELTPSSPPPSRYQAAMIYDSTIGNFILFGGAHLNTGRSASFRHDFSDTWAFDLATESWTNLNPAGNPPAFSVAREAMVWDDSTGQALLFVGAEPIPDVTPLREEDWSIYGYHAGGNTWAEEPRSPTSPPISERYALALDSSLHTAVLFGGTDAERDTRGETWIFDLGANTWRRVLVGGAGSPPSRIDSAMVYDSETETMILFGGRSTDGRPADLPNDTWEYRP